jgi:hypothetical protein
VGARARREPKDLGETREVVSLEHERGHITSLMAFSLSENGLVRTAK